MGSYVPNTLEERQEMLKEIGYSSIEDLLHIFLMRLRSKAD